jgi:hypothetical protein
MRNRLRKNSDSQMYVLRVFEDEVDGLHFTTAANACCPQTGGGGDGRESKAEPQRQPLDAALCDVHLGFQAASSPPSGWPARPPTRTWG